MAKKYRLKQILLMAGMKSIILPVGYTVELKGDRYIGEGGWYFHPHGVEDNKYHWEEVVEKEFVWDDYLVIELLSSYAPFADNIYTIPKHIESFKELKSNSIKSGKGTANDVLNTEKKFENLKHGLYRVFWKKGGSSLAAIGHTYDGTNWYAPCNWTSEFNEYPKVASTDWSKVERIELIEEVNYSQTANDVLNTEDREIASEEQLRKGYEYSYKEWKRLNPMPKYEQSPFPSQPQNNKEKVGVYVGSYNHGPKYGHVGQYDFICDREIMDGEFRAIETAISKILNHE